MSESKFIRLILGRKASTLIGENVKFDWGFMYIVGDSQHMNTFFVVVVLFVLLLLQGFFYLKKYFGC